ncbi:MAG: response regulator transcription factor [Bacteroidales bacterium]|nr:response regulator transcription factor [Bacteroidales bacterium]
MVVEHSPVIAAGLRELFSESTAFEVTALCADWTTALEQLPLRKPHVLLLNPLQLDFSKRLMLRRQLQDYPRLLTAALQTGYVEQAVLGQFHVVLEIDDNLARMEGKLLAAFNAREEECAGETVCGLSEREVEVLKVIAKGATNKMAADELNLSVHTVITHRKNIVRKTGIKTLAGLTLYALLNRLIDESEIQ